MSNNYFNDFGSDTGDSFEEKKKALIEEGLYRSSKTGDKIFLVKEGKKYWITSPEVLIALGYNFGQEKSVDDLSIFESGDPIRIENVENFLTLPSLISKEKVKVEEVKIPAQQEEGVPHAIVKGLISVIVLVLDVDIVKRVRELFNCEIITVTEEDVRSELYGDKLVKDIEAAQRIATGEFIFILGDAKKV